MQSKPLLVYQIPRTGTTSISNYVSHILRPEELATFKVVEEVYAGKAVSAQSSAPSITKAKSYLENVSSKTRCALIMAPYGLHFSLPFDVKLATVLRRPAQRCLSLYRFMKSKPNLNKINREVNAAGRDFEKFVLGKKTICFRNEQTRMLSGSENIDCTTSDLNKAKYNLSKFDHVGFFEKINEFSKVLSESLEREQSTLMHLNKAEIEVEGEEQLLKLFSSENELDAELYEWASKELNGQSDLSS